MFQFFTASTKYLANGDAGTIFCAMFRKMREKLLFVVILLANVGFTLFESQRDYKAPEF